MAIAQKQIKADPKAVYARQGHAAVDKEASRKLRMAAQRALEWRRAHGLK